MWASVGGYGLSGRVCPGQGAEPGVRGRPLWLGWLLIPSEARDPGHGYGIVDVPAMSLEQHGCGIHAL